MAWHEVLLKKTGNTVTYSIDGLLIATMDLAVCGPLGGGKIGFSHFDINATASVDPNAPALAFSLVDNVCVTDLCLGDTEPPTLTLPADITVPATSPAGATVYFNVSASDNCPNPVTVVCEPPSGSTFPIGVTTVACVAEDAAGNTTVDGFDVTVKGPAEQIADLIGLVESIPILPGLANSLLVKLQAAGAAVSRGSMTAACGELAAFVNQVSAHAGKTEISPELADQLIQEATRIRTVLGCIPPAP
jgi:hypothetical protein